MWEFFRDWRRKIGVFTLVMACAVLAAWGRSHISNHSIDAPFGKTITYHAKLTTSGIEISTTQQFDLENNQQLRFVGNRVVIETMKINIESKDARGTHPKLVNEIEDGMEIHASSFICRSDGTVISYWYFITPLTLLSAYLILSKPRVAKNAVAGGK